MAYFYATATQVVTTGYPYAQPVGAPLITSFATGGITTSTVAFVDGTLLSVPVTGKYLVTFQVLLQSNANPAEPTGLTAALAQIVYDSIEQSYFANNLPESVVYCYAASNATPVQFSGVLSLTAGAYYAIAVTPSNQDVVTVQFAEGMPTTTLSIVALFS